VKGVAVVAAGVPPHRGDAPVTLGSALFNWRGASLHVNAAANAVSRASATRVGRFPRWGNASMMRGRVSLHAIRPALTSRGASPRVSDTPVTRGRRPLHWGAASLMRGNSPLSVKGSLSARARHRTQPSAHGRHGDALLFNWGHASGTRIGDAETRASPHETRTVHCVSGSLAPTTHQTRVLACRRRSDLAIRGLLWPGVGGIER
jgi:hypothetical protein